MANSVDPDQTAPKEQFDLGLHCLLRPVCPSLRSEYLWYIQYLDTLLVWRYDSVLRLLWLISCISVILRCWINMIKQYLIKGTELITSYV